MKELKYEQNEEGMYEISGFYDNGEEFRTGFVFDSVKQWPNHSSSFRVSQTDAEGNRKFGLIRDVFWCPNGKGGIFYTSCIFDKIKPYGSGFQCSILKAYIGEEEFIIRDNVPFCSVYKPDFHEIYESNEEKWLARLSAENS